MKSKSILDLSAKEARSFFLKNDSYCNIDLPNYINFQILINSLSKKIANKAFDSIYQSKKNKPSNHENINHTLLSNKDGRFSWRPLKLIHPALYVSLAHQTTNPNNWTLIKNRLNAISKKVNSRIECKSLPRVSLSSESDKATQVNTWWQEIEQVSLKMSIDFSCIIHADIADCYGSIYTHSIPWAVHGKKRAKNEKGNCLIGNKVDTILRDMSFGQTNGIPQGSVLMDFLAEIVLSYIDLNCYIKLHSLDYKVIRYRDDYRIFTQNESDSLRVLKVLSEVLASLGMKLNADKTVISDNLIKESIKPDKWFILNNSMRHRGLQKQLMFIHKLSGLHPNSGSVKKELLLFYKRLHKKKNIKEDIAVLISIASDIAYKNPSTYQNVAAILSKLISHLDENNKTTIFNKVKKRFDTIPNTGLIDIWLQRISIASNVFNETQFKEPLCEIVSQPNSVKNDILWESDWLIEELKGIVCNTAIIDADRLNKIKPIIEIDEISLFEEKYP
ncbi:reverse transcriptase (RNA-dependent DNA polymerase) [Methylobacter tundripaludum]|uniref:Reverse transcriptase (RNA-dependent DNA polymerase) n=1 Tax=Methylobacter tundripaludum TaxID=173365 RepID=A0A2S6H404_9GAMM|nr:RNA-directed DNA polymerase [Methylobacter tundripaludum]PPK72215.1 reverse transcriptase (RNA-dependent DNA polymerase) [Methylobacter tundripaludum]